MDLHMYVYSVFPHKINTGFRHRYRKLYDFNHLKDPKSQLSEVFHTTT